MKIFLWIFTVVGLVPLVAFAILHITSCVAMRRAMPPQPDHSDDSTVMVIANATVRLGESGSPMAINLRAWPAILILVGASICFVGLFFLIPRQPLRVSQNGYARLEPLIRRVTSSASDHPSLIVSAREGNEALLVMRGESGWEVSLSAESKDADTISRIKSYFSERGVTATQDYTTTDDEFDIERTHLAYPLTGDAAAMAQTCIQIFRDVVGVTNDEPMEFSVEL